MASIYANLLEQKKACTSEKNSSLTGLIWNSNVASVTSCAKDLALTFNTIFASFVDFFKGQKTLERTKIQDKHFNIYTLLIVDSFGCCIIVFSHAFSFSLFCARHCSRNCLSQCHARSFLACVADA